MKIEYDHEADALYIQFRGVSVEDNVDVEEGVTVDLGEDGLSWESRSLAPDRGWELRPSPISPSRTCQWKNQQIKERSGSRYAL